MEGAEHSQHIRNHLPFLYKAFSMCDALVRKAMKIRGKESKKYIRTHLI
jgi:hypothetical protein